jgi:hypothetical protein
MEQQRPEKLSDQGRAAKVPKVHKRRHPTPVLSQDSASTTPFAPSNSLAQTGLGSETCGS